MKLESLTSSKNVMLIYDALCGVLFTGKALTI